MAGMDRNDLLHLVLQFLEQENYKETLHSLESESKVFFNLRYFEEKVIRGEWDELEKYMSGFTKLDDNLPSIKLYFEIRHQKYLEALDSGDKRNAMRILRDELNVFAGFNMRLYFKETAHLLVLDNIREAPHLSNYVDAQTARASLLNKLRSLIMQNPLLRDKLQLPTLPEGSLQTKLNQSLNWQHLHCENPLEVPVIRTLYVDHTCEQLNADHPLSPGVNNVNSSDNTPKTGVANLSQGSSV